MRINTYSQIFLKIVIYKTFVYICLMNKHMHSNTYYYQFLIQGTE